MSQRLLRKEQYGNVVHCFCFIKRADDVIVVRKQNIEKRDGLHKFFPVISPASSTVSSIGLAQRQPPKKKHKMELTKKSTKILNDKENETSKKVEEKKRNEKKTIGSGIVVPNRLKRLQTLVANQRRWKLVL